MMTKLLATFMMLCSHSFLPFTITPTKVARNSKSLNDIMFGNLSSIISDHLIQFLIESFNLTVVSSLIAKGAINFFAKLKSE